MKNSKLFYTIKGLDYGEVLAMHAFIKEKDDAERSKRGAKKGRIRRSQPMSPTEQAELIAYKATLQCEDNLFDEEVYEVPSERPARIRPMPKDRTLIAKYELFIHNLIARQIASDNGTAYLNSQVLQAVFDKDYKLIKRALISLHIICSDGFYDIGTKSYGFYLHPDYLHRIQAGQKPMYYPYRPYVESLNRQQKQQQNQIELTVRENLSDDFFSAYSTALQSLSLSYRQEATNFVNIHFSKDNFSKVYHQYIIDQYIKHGKFAIKVPNTKDNRIYHILTSTPRNLKYFLNIRFSVDIHNSHPLLLSSLIYDHYQVPIEYRKNISLYIRDMFLPSYNVYNVRVKLYNKLLNSEIDYPKIKQIPLDVFKYLYFVSVGKFWDIVLPQLNAPTDGNYSIIRQDVKVIMFAQVFYGKQLSSRGQEYAKVFAKQFPNVYSIILGFKRGLAKVDRTVLTHKLMALESHLFREALKRLYNMGYKVVSIHDAIVVLDVKENDTCAPDVVKGVLTEVYGEMGLVPDCSVDTYGKDEMLSFMEREMFLRERGDAYIDQLRARADDPDIHRLLEDYDRGKSEIILTPDKQDVMLHLRDTKELMYR